MLWLWLWTLTIKLHAGLPLIGIALALVAPGFIIFFHAAAAMRMHWIGWRNGRQETMWRNSMRKNCGNKVHNMNVNGRQSGGVDLEYTALVASLGNGLLGVVEGN